MVNLCLKLYLQIDIGNQIFDYVECTPNSMRIRVTPLLRKLFPFFLLLRGNGICYGSKYFITAIVKATTVEPTSFTEVMHLLFLPRPKTCQIYHGYMKVGVNFFIPKREYRNLLKATYFMYSRKFRVLEMKIEEKVFLLCIIGVNQS